MIIEEYENDIRIEFSKVTNMPDGTPPASPYFMLLTAVDIPESWVPEVLHIEKYGRIFMHNETPSLTGELEWDYIIHLEKTQNEYIKLIFRHKNVALSTLKHLKYCTQPDFKTEFPELFL